jgi:hypothetical protein
MIGLSVLTLNVNAQTDFYTNSYVREVKIYFKESNWDYILDSLYIEDEQNRMLGDVEVDGVLYTDVGIRYKGFSSASINRVKNPFNIKLNYVNNDQNHEGFNKLKLSNVIHDPSFVREVLAYEIARKYMPASKANFANVYVNDTLIGLYTNVESVESDFLKTHFGSNNQSFFKGNPEALDLNGENANLSNTPGSDPEEYVPFYVQKSDNSNDWENLEAFINILNTDEENIDNVLNIDRALWMHAFNYSVINFDSYIGYAQNYYLYQSENGQFNPILWDLNQSFASFRLTDASTYYQGFSVNEAQTLDPLSHYSIFSVYPRPLMTALFANSTYSRMYIAHIRTIMEENFDNQDYYLRATYFQNLISSSVANDTNKFYSTTDFNANIDVTVSDLIEYPGLSDLMDNRATYLSTYDGMTGEPIVTNSTDSNYDFGGSVNFKTSVIDGNEAFLFYRYSSNQKFTQLSLNDDGVNGDEVAGDNLYSIQLEDCSNTIQYYFYAQNDSAGTFLPHRAATEFFTISTILPKGALVINEFDSENNNENANKVGLYEDWIELYNTTDYLISADSLVLVNSNSIESNTIANRMIGKVIFPHDYLVLWADDDVSEGSDHLNFKLDADGEFVGLQNASGEFLDSLTFYAQNKIFSYGRYPDGTGEFTEMYSSFSAQNLAPIDDVFTSSLYLFPNPTQDIFYIQTTLELPYLVRIFSVNGTFISELEIQDEGIVELSTELMSSGVYTVSIIKDETLETKKITIIH